MKKKQLAEIPEHSNIQEAIKIKDTIRKYLSFWHWFPTAIIACAALGFIYLRYAPVTYESVAKIRIIDDSKGINVALDPASLLTGSNGINLENEIEILRSYRLLSQVVEDLSLDIEIYDVGNIKTTPIWSAPFELQKTIAEDDIRSPEAFDFVIQMPRLIITDINENQFTYNLTYPDTLSPELPFTISLKDEYDISAYNNNTFKVIVNSVEETVLKLANDLRIHPSNKKSEILKLAIRGQNVERSETILNTLINKFNQDGILDRQLVSRRTMEVIDKRFVDLASELDSIEVGKQDFKQENRLSFIEADAGITLQRRTEAEEELADLENQISLSRLLKKTVINQAEYSILPADIGLENSSLNNLVANYNQLAFQREKLLPSVGANHPNLMALSGQLERAKVNIIKSINIYQAQLRTSLGRLNQEKIRTGSIFSELPEQEKQLRAIERQQSIKEKLFLLLLEKREEAAINMATTIPSVKVVDYGITSSKPISPKRELVYPLSLVVGFILPIAFLYVRFSLDTKVQDREDLEQNSPQIPILSEIPLIKKQLLKHGFDNRSVLAEAFRILGSSVQHRFSEDASETGHVVYVTSSVKGEGKTFIAVNLALALATLKKEVLLISADLRNPQFHTYLDILKKAKGLAEYLEDPGIGVENVINQGIHNDINLSVCFSRKVPPNVTELLTKRSFGNFLDKLKNDFEYIIVDTAPTLLVNDTLLISKHADITLYTTRVGLTEKKLLEYAKKLHREEKLNEMHYVVNAAGLGKSRGYNYGYGYGYGTK